MGPLLWETPVAVDEVKTVRGEVSTTRKSSKKPVIDIESDDAGDDDFTESWLLKEVRCTSSLLLNLFNLYVSTFYFYLLFCC